MSRIRNDEKVGGRMLTRADFVSKLIDIRSQGEEKKEQKWICQIGRVIT